MFLVVSLEMKTLWQSHPENMGLIPQLHIESYALVLSLGQLHHPSMVYIMLLDLSWNTQMP